ncbi:atherin-like [Ischnura elegans]|uniref:atherin-like n=1 Tax=Ischnura elegans TaxID=197161 RepID=UPI001ED88DC8|nr:atherin-like [Ischnura elegans]XP_046393702.1 atherin-like [Ischnura elegans]
MAKARAKKFKSPGTKDDHVDPPPPNLPCVTVHPPRQGEGADGWTSSGHVAGKPESPLTSPHFPFHPRQRRSDFLFSPTPGLKTNAHWLAAGPSSKYNGGPRARKGRTEEGGQGVGPQRAQPRVVTFSNYGGGASTSSPLRRTRAFGDTVSHPTVQTSLRTDAETTPPRPELRPSPPATGGSSAPPAEPTWRFQPDAAAVRPTPVRAAPQPATAYATAARTAPVRAAPQPAAAYAAAAARTTPVRAAPQPAAADAAAVRTATPRLAAHPVRRRDQATPEDQRPEGGEDAVRALAPEAALQATSGPPGDQHPRTN